MSKIPMSDLNKRDLFLSFAFYSKGRQFSITKFDIVIFCNILHLEMNFGNMYYLLFDKYLVNINIHKKLKKKRK